MAAAAAEEVGLGFSKGMIWELVISGESLRIFRGRKGILEGGA